VMGDPGQRDCPAGSVPVPDAEACAAAAESLGKQLLEEGYAAESDPPGCQFRVPDQDIYFNSHDTGAPNPARQRVCKQDGSAPPAPAPAKPAAKSDATLLGAGNERSTRRVGSMSWVTRRPTTARPAAKLSPAPKSVRQLRTSLGSSTWA
ncbi:unnamed protein product, partial [Effrenium voratum]